MHNNKLLYDKDKIFKKNYKTIINIKNIREYYYLK